MCQVQEIILLLSLYAVFSMMFKQQLTESNIFVFLLYKSFGSKKGHLLPAIPGHAGHYPGSIPILNNANQILLKRCRPIAGLQTTR